MCAASAPTCGSSSEVKSTATAADSGGVRIWILLAAVLLFPSSSAALYMRLATALSGEVVLAGLIAIAASSVATAALCVARKWSWPRLVGLTAVTAMLSLVAVVVTSYVGLATCGADCVG
jgi:hypothetical protein